MEKTKKITVEVPEPVLKQAMAATGTGISETVRYGLEMVAAKVAFARLQTYRGKLKLSRWQDLKEDRE